MRHGLWHQLFGESHSVLGQELTINSRPYTTVGVMPRIFDFVDPEALLWMPIAFTPEEKTVHRSNNYYNIARLKPGATLDPSGPLPPECVDNAWSNAGLPPPRFF